MKILHQELLQGQINIITRPCVYWTKIIVSLDTNISGQGSKTGSEEIRIRNVLGEKSNFLKNSGNHRRCHTLFFFFTLFSFSPTEIHFLISLSFAGWSLNEGAAVSQGGDTMKPFVNSVQSEQYEVLCYIKVHLWTLKAVMQKTCSYLIIVGKLTYSISSHSFSGLFFWHLLS